MEGCVSGSRPRLIMFIHFSRQQQTQLKGGKKTTEKGQTTKKLDELYVGVWALEYQA